MSTDNPHLTPSEHAHILLHGLTSAGATLESIRQDVESLPASVEAERKRISTNLDIIQREVEDQIYSAENTLSGLYPEYYQAVDQLGQRPTHVNPLRILREVLPSHRAIAERRNIEILEPSPESDADFPSISVAPGMIRRTFHNVLSNAIKYSYHGSGVARNIRIEAHRFDAHGRMWAVSLQNYGIGILPAELSDVFKPGVRGALAVEDNRTGAGLGLSDVSAVMRLHGGKAKIASQELQSGTYLTTVSLIFSSSGLLRR